jgi:hypothetical protein
VDIKKLKDAAFQIGSMLEALVELKQLLASYANVHAKSAAVMIELVALSDDSVDAILSKHGITVVKDGCTLFPRAEKGKKEGEDLPRIVFDPSKSN